LHASPNAFLLPFPFASLLSPAVLLFVPIQRFYFIYIFCSLDRPASRIFLHLTSLMKVLMGKAHPVSTPTKMEAGLIVKVQF
jgi:hypothetical protein